MTQIYTVFETDFGWVALLGEGGKVVEATLPKPTREQAIHDLAGISSQAVEDSQGFGNLPERIKAYFQGENIDLACDMDFSGISAFELRVYQELMKLPRGSTISYGELAIAAGRPGAARAVGNAMKKNPIPVIVPCHRVLHSDGSIGGFGGGADMKRKMLMLEGVDI
jgi:methylated-DNA-[protein]-cysteine S-methyltransferase